MYKPLLITNHSFQYTTLLINVSSFQLIDTESNYSPSSMIWCKETPCDYGSCHPPECSKFNKQQIEEWCIETGSDIYVNRVLEEILPQAIMLDIQRRASSNDKTWKGKFKRHDKLLISYIKTQNKSYCKKHVKPYYSIFDEFDELTKVDGAILCGSQIVIHRWLST